MKNVTKYRYNAMKITSVEEFFAIRGGVKNGCRDVYFLRLLGEHKGMLDKLLVLEKEERPDAYLRIDALTEPKNGQELAFYKGCCEEWLAGGRNQIRSRCIDPKQPMADFLGKVFKDVLELYEKHSDPSNSGKRILIVMLLYWFDRFMKDLLPNWDKYPSVKITGVNVRSEHEYLFYYLLTRAGCDVMLLQIKYDIDEDVKRYGGSVERKAGGFSDTVLKPFVAVPWRLQGELPLAARKKQADSANVPLTMSTKKPEKGAQGNVPLTMSTKKPEKGEPVGQNTQGNVPLTMNTKKPEKNTQGVQSPQKENSGGNISMKIPPKAGRKETTPQNSSNSSTLKVSVPEIMLPTQTPSVAVPSSSPVNGSRQEKSYEELAAMASSVVMIACHEADGSADGTGSGIMIGRNGYILTNFHVINGGSAFSVRIENDDQIYVTNEVIKYNNVQDLAIIRIQRQLKPLPIYHGAPLIRGQKVVAIGSPLGLFNSVSDGIISGFRNVHDKEMIQFTAPTSPGSSGGALLNMYGEVIGISTAGISEGQNLNLAVSFEMVYPFVCGFADAK